MLTARPRTPREAKQYPPANQSQSTKRRDHSEPTRRTQRHRIKAAAENQGAGNERDSGRALDITTPGFTALEEEFENSPAFAWLKKNARRFGFHMSYPRRNPHGIAYEPWHWSWSARLRDAE